MLQSPSTFKLEKIILNTPQDMFDSINVATAASLLQKHRSRNAQAMDKLLHISQSRQFGPRELATLCSSVAMGGLTSKLPSFLIDQLESSDLSQFAPQDLSRCVSALSHLDQPSRSVLERIARDIEARGFVGRHWERNDVTTVLHALAQVQGLTSPSIVHHLQVWLQAPTNNLERLTNKHLVSLVQSVSVLSPPYFTEASLSIFTAELRKRKDFKAYECSMLVHSLTKLKLKDQQVKSALLEQTASLVTKFTLCGCSLLLSAFSDRVVWGIPSTHMLEGICKQVCALDWPASTLNDLALIIHALSILEHKDVAVFDKLLKDITTGRVLSELSNSDFSLAMQAFARFRKLDEYAFKQLGRPQEADYVAHTWRKIVAKERPALLAMAREFSRRDSREFTANDLCNILHSFANLDIAAVGSGDWSKLECELRERGLQDLSSKQITMFAAALPRNTNSTLVTVLAQEVQRRGLRDFTWQDLCCTARALVQFGRDGFDASLFATEVMSSSSPWRTLAKCTGQDLSMLMWTFCTARYKNDALVAKLGEEIYKRDLSRLTSTSLSSLVLSFAHYYGNAHSSSNSKCVDLLCSEVCSPARQFSPQAYCNVMWALACMDRFPAAFFNKESKHEAARTVEAAQQILQTKLAYKQQKSDSRLIASLLGSNVEWAVNLVKCDTFRDTPSQVQETVTRLVRDGLVAAGGTDGGVWYQREALLENCMLVDMYIPSLRVVIEVNGKGHYMSDSITPTGRSMFKARMLRRCGYRVFGVNVQQFQLLNDNEQQREMNELARSCLNDSTNSSAVWNG